MKIGKFDRRITIEQPTETRNAANEKVKKSWSTFKSAYAEIVDQRGDEKFAAAQTSAQMARIFRVRYTTGITEQMRIQFDGKVYNIKSIVGGGTRNREYLDIMSVRQDGASQKS